MREWTGLTQEELAKELGYKNYHTVKQIEKGVNKFTFHTLLEILNNHDIEIIIQKNENKKH